MVRLRSRANRGFMLPKNRRARAELHARLQAYVDKAEPASLASRVAKHPKAAAGTHQMTQWLFAFDPAGMTTAYVALGSNLGDREQILRDALDAMRKLPGVSVTRVSTFLENPAVGGPPDSPPFLNAVAEVQTSLSARQLLHGLLQIEQSLGRVRREKWEPRVIDLDLILFGEETIHEDGLTVPHPLMHKRRFVLEPLAEVAPDARHPTLNKSAVELLNVLTNDKQRVTSNKEQAT
jgi:2-amino-4-hydroxy-6-hydroxymethyldihydropteridine diphosphokinase